MTHDPRLPNSPKIADIIREYAIIYNQTAATPAERQQLHIRLRALDALLKALAVNEQMISRKRLAALEQKLDQLQAKP